MSNKLNATFGMDFHTQVLARDNHQCQAQRPGCTHTATTVELTRTPRELRALKREADNPDNWQSVCENCRQAAINVTQHHNP